MLRLTALTSMAEHNTHTVQQYRRKPPSQQNRDKKRAEEHSKRFSQHKERQTDALKNQQASDFIDFGFELFNKIPEPCAHEHEYRDVHVQHSESMTRTHSYTAENIKTAQMPQSVLTHKPRPSLLLIPGQRKVSLLTAVHKTH